MAKGQKAVEAKASSVAQGVRWASPGFVDTPNRTKSAIGVSHGEEAAAAIVHAGVQGGSGQGGAAERQERRVVARELDLTETSLAERQGGGTAAAG